MDDAPSIQKYFNDYEVVRNLSDVVPWPYPAGGAEAFLGTVLEEQGHDRWVWGICFRNFPEKLIGIVELKAAQSEENRGFWLAREFWGRGIMTEAVQVVTRHAFTALGFKRLILKNSVNNKRSHSIKKREGAKIMYIELAKFIDASVTQQEVWVLTKEDWYMNLSKNA